ncbi:MAG: tRNA (adenosine(37)-N6)-threonylcarbamoyltransferase complex transferase subunit TsaD [Legionellaceae bacterium]|nr:tRNA (adenosine(37)-N6)-threonylcarbamoyltransferase complex transferase subunit TsaD [Legionellaceae bacterium]
MRVLGVETSCDETGLAIYEAGKGLLAHVLYSQVSTHQPYGGVVPELASRDHVRYLVPLLDQVLLDAHLTISEIDAVAYTAGPGLVGALLTGTCFGKSLAYALGKPAIAVHHLEAHMLAAQLASSELTFPFLVLLVSGGHTQLWEAKDLGHYTLLGETLDDAVGEAFDKTAKLMGLPYPGGAILAQLADSPSASPLPAFPRPMIHKKGFDFSFSGLKTHAWMAWQASTQDEQARQNIAHAFQEAVVETLVIKCEKALEFTGHEVLVVAGGVGANRLLRQNLQVSVAAKGKKVYFPDIEYCTDNGAMIAYAGCLHLLKGEQDTDLSMAAHPRWALSE